MTQLLRIPRYHWGLNFNGISIGQEAQEVLFCDGQTASSRCGIIPDAWAVAFIIPVDGDGP